MIFLRSLRIQSTWVNKETFSKDGKQQLKLKYMMLSRDKCCTIQLWCSTRNVSWMKVVSILASQSIFSLPVKAACTVPRLVKGPIYTCRVHQVKTQMGFNTFWFALDWMCLRWVDLKSASIQAPCKSGWALFQSRGWWCQERNNLKHFRS